MIKKKVKVHVYWMQDATVEVEVEGNSNEECRQLATQIVKNNPDLAGDGEFVSDSFEVDETMMDEDEEQS